MMEEEVVRYDNIVNNEGIKRPQEKGEWVMWKEYEREYQRGRVFSKRNLQIRDAQYVAKRNGIQATEGPRVIPQDAYGARDDGQIPVRVNREHIPYEFPRGKDDIRFYHAMKGGRSENIPGRKDASTEYNYARDALEELWGGEGVIRGHTFSALRREHPQLSHQFNATWWPERRYNHRFTSMILGEVIQTVTTESCLDQIDNAGGFDEYIIYTSPAKLMSDLGCRLKQQMLYTINDPDRLLQNLKVSILHRKFNFFNYNCSLLVQCILTSTQPAWPTIIYKSLNQSK